MKRLTRRSFLRGVSGSALALPLLPSLMGKAGAAENGAFPCRVIFFSTPGGVIDATRFNVRHPTNFEFGPSLAPLESHRSRLTILDNIRLATADVGVGDPHARGMAHGLTGMPITDVPLFGSANVAQFVGWGGGISVDQELANRLVGVTPIDSLQLGVHANASRPEVTTILSYAGANRPMAAEDHANRTFDRVFGLTPQVKSRRRRILDLVRADLSDIEGRIGRADHPVLQAHLDAVERLENRYASATAEQCEGVGPRPQPPQTIGDFAAHGRQQVDLLVHALRCDLTRVATVQWGVGEGTFSFLGHDEIHHAIQHWGHNSAESRAQLTQIDTWFSQQFAYLLDSLAAVPEGDGTLLDNTVVLWLNELDEPWHATPALHTNMPYILAGGAAGKLRGGQLLDFSGRGHIDLLVSMLNLMGYEDQTFGMAELCRGPLPGLIV